MLRDNGVDMAPGFLTDRFRFNSMTLFEVGKSGFMLAIRILEAILCNGETMPYVLEFDAEVDILIGELSLFRFKIDDYTKCVRTVQALKDVAIPLVLYRSMASVSLSPLLAPPCIAWTKFPYRSIISRSFSSWSHAFKLEFLVRNGVIFDGESRNFFFLDIGRDGAGDALAGVLKAGFDTGGVGGFIGVTGTGSLEIAGDFKALSTDGCTGAGGSKERVLNCVLIDVILLPTPWVWDCGLGIWELGHSGVLGVLLPSLPRWEP